jgi:predicted butyrate kinase (DUF1464 family)
VTLRVAGCDPGTSSLDIVALDDGAVIAQMRFTPEQLAAGPDAVIEWFQNNGPFALIAGPSGYGTPLVHARDCTEDHFARMIGQRPGDTSRGVTGFSRLVRGLAASGLPFVFLPGVVHLASVPAYRKHNRIDMGTADKLCVVALACSQAASLTACVVEIGSAFTACLAVEQGRVVDGYGGTSGPIGWGSGGAWDGEVAYLRGTLVKEDLFRGGAEELGDDAGAALREGVCKTVAALSVVCSFRRVLLSGRLFEARPDITAPLDKELSRWGTVERLPSLSGAWVKHAAQGAAVIADGLAGGQHAEAVFALLGR